jgi:hypothetical protein
MIQDDENPAAEPDAGTEPAKRARRRRSATVTDIAVALRRIEKRDAPSKEPSFVEVLEKVRDTLAEEGRAIMTGADGGNHD